MSSIWSTPRTFALALARLQARTTRLRGTGRLLRALSPLAPTSESALRYVGEAHGSLFQIDTSSLLEWHLYAYGDYEIGAVRLLERLAYPGAVVFDVGANVGSFTLPLARAVGPLGAVHAFEPHPMIRARLAENCALNNLRWVTLADCALGREESTATLYGSTTGNQGASSLRDLGHPSEPLTVEVSTLDQYVEDRGLGCLDLLKIDVEGADLDVLRGARESLRRFRPAVYIEVFASQLAAFGASPLDVWRTLDELGYRIWRNDRVEHRRVHLTPITAEYASSPVELDNWLAVHPQSVTRA